MSSPTRRSSPGRQAETESGDHQEICDGKSYKFNRWNRFHAAFMMMTVLSVNKVAGFGIGTVTRLFLAWEKRLFSTTLAWVGTALMWFIVLILIWSSMKLVAGVEKWMYNTAFVNASSDSISFLRKKYIKTVFVPRLVESVSFACGLIVATLLIGSEEGTGFVCSVPRLDGYNEWVHKTADTIFSIAATVLVTAVVGFALHKYYKFTLCEEEDENTSISTIRKTFFETVNWSCAAYFFNLVNPNDFDAVGAWNFAVVIFRSFVGALVCITLSLVSANLHEILWQKSKAGLYWKNVVLFSLISVELVTQSTMVMAILFVSNSLNFQIIYSKSIWGTLVWTIVSFLLISCLLWVTLITNESQIKEVQMVPGTKKRRTTVLRGWNPLRFWIETWAASYLLAACIKKVENKYISPARTSAGYVLFVIIVFCEIAVGYGLLAMTSNFNNKIKEQLLIQAEYEPIASEEM